jgi:hypothetical protein
MMIFLFLKERWCMRVREGLKKFNLIDIFLFVLICSRLIALKKHTHNVIKIIENFR